MQRYALDRLSDAGRDYPGATHPEIHGELAQNGPGQTQSSGRQDLRPAQAAEGLAIQKPVAMPPQPFEPRVVHQPAGISQQHGGPATALATVLPRQLDHVGHPA